MSRAESSASRRRRAATRRRALKRNYHAQATYATNAGLWAHPYGAVAAEGLWAHVDRVGVRVPDAASTKKRSLQRSLTPHLDCCPDRLHAGGGKRFPRWRPIQCFLALDDALEADQGGFECCGGFHRRFEAYYADRAARAGGALPCGCQQRWCQ